MMEFARPRSRRRVSLTPMIDVVFLLLVFFMLAARFGFENSLVLSAGTGSVAWEGAPRLVDVSADGLRLNGVSIAPADLGAALRPLMPAGGTVILRPIDGANLQQLVVASEILTAAGAGRVLIVE
jgi:biopolymer transport protein ExbD